MCGKHGQVCGAKTGNPNVPGAWSTMSVVPSRKRVEVQMIGGMGNSVGNRSEVRRWEWHAQCGHNNGQPPTGMPHTIQTCCRILDAKQTSPLGHKQQS